MSEYNTGTFNVYRCRVDKETGALLENFRLIEEEIYLESDAEGNFEYDDGKAVSNCLYAYVVHGIDNDYGIALNPEFFVYYLNDYLLDTLHSNYEYKSKSTLHGEIIETGDMAKPYNLEFNSATNEALVDIIAPGGSYPTYRCAFDYRLSTSNEWIRTTWQNSSSGASQSFFSNIPVSVSGAYYVRGVAEVQTERSVIFDNTIKYEVYTNPLLVNINV